MGTPYFRSLNHFPIYTCLIFQLKAVFSLQHELQIWFQTRSHWEKDYFRFYQCLSHVLSQWALNRVWNPPSPLLVQRQGHFLRIWIWFCSKWSRPPWLISFLFLLPLPIPFLSSCNHLDLTWHANWGSICFTAVCSEWLEFQVVMFVL